MSPRRLLCGCVAALTAISMPRGETGRIVISGGDLAAPVEISDPDVTHRFNVWTGPGTSVDEQQGMIVDWSKGAVTPPRGAVYQVSLMTDRTGANTTYRVDYAIDPVSKRGYVFIPPKGDPRFAENSLLIYRSSARPVEGRWFHAWDEWEKAAHPLIERAAKIR